jgi:hypothetical protein
MTTFRTGLVMVALTASLLGCPKKGPDPADGGDAAPVASGMPAEGGAATGGDAGADDVQPVYPIEPNAPPMPLAQKLCTGLHEMQEKKRATCCTTTPGVVITSECTRTLSAALRYKAIEMSEASVDGCVAAFEKTLEGCDWVGPFAPGPPAACRALVKGLLGDGQKCRSSLECSGNLRCKGVGPTTPGKCGPAKAVGEICGGTVDTLATYARQTDLDAQHPECAAGRCIKHRCAPPAPENGECHVTLDCQDGLQCLVSGPPPPKPKKGEHLVDPHKKCVRRALPREGEACPGGVCDGELSCTLGKCAARKPGGAECTNDFECRGGCLKPEGAAKGKCGARCDIR